MGEFAEKNPRTPAVENDVVNIGRENVILMAYFPKPEPVEGPLAEVEPEVCFPGQYFADVVPFDNLDDKGEVDACFDALESLAAGGFSKYRAQAAVAADEKGEGFLQRIDIQVALDAEGRRDVVGGGAFLELIEEPQP